ncbi:MAG: hypothetical protein LBQ46_13890 [Treponema sp.]|nr:hypothetical protein [Treponema sp.]
MKNFFKLVGLIAAAAIIVLAGCPTDPGGGGTGGPPAATDVTIYTLNGEGELEEYTGTGSEQTVTAEMYLPAGDDSPAPKSLGTIGSITADGKLTLNIPETVEDDSLFDGAVVGISGKIGYFDITPSLTLYAADGSSFIDTIIYTTTAGYIVGYSSRKGWNYWGDDDAAVTDISAYKWVIN